MPRICELRTCAFFATVRFAPLVVGCSIFLISKVNSMKKLLPYCLIALLLTGCADAVNIDTCTIDSPYGFLSGIWHGMILFFSFWGSLFSEDITIYAVNNTGFFYDMGFMMGAGSSIFGASKAS